MGLMKSLGHLPGRRGGSGRHQGIEITLTVDPIAQARLEKSLMALPEKAFNRVVPSACSYAMTPVVKMARHKAIRKSGTLSRSIGKRAKKYGRNHAQTLWVGARPGFKDPTTGENPQNISHLVEFGTAPHKVGNRNHPGARAYPFLRPALDTNKESVIRRYREKLLKGIEKEAKKLGGK